MAQQRAVVTKEDDIWVLRLETPNGKTQVYRCATESQARALAAVLARPDVGPPSSGPPSP